jgi:hypothetical protein
MWNSDYFIIFAKLARSLPVLHKIMSSNTAEIIIAVLSQVHCTGYTVLLPAIIWEASNLI